MSGFWIFSGRGFVSQRPAWWVLVSPSGLAGGVEYRVMAIERK